MSEEYQGKYQRDPDDDLRAIGVNITDWTKEDPIDAENQAEEGQTEGKAGWRRFQAACALVAGVGLLFYMVMTGKIDTGYGVIFTAGVSAVCGYRMN